jgi:hypothetical protein
MWRLVFGALAALFLVFGAISAVAGGAELFGLRGTEVTCGATVMRPDDGCAEKRISSHDHEVSLVPRAFAHGAAPHVAGGSMKTLTQMHRENRTSGAVGIGFGSMAVVIGAGLATLVIRAQRAARAHRRRQRH